MESVTWLICQGVEYVDVNVATSTGTTALTEAAKVGRWDIVRHLEDCGARCNPGRDQVSVTRWQIWQRSVAEP